MPINENVQLSIIIPVYNVEKYVDECLKSIIKQYRNNLEIILINDGSTDDSTRICEMYCKQYENIRLFNQKNKGLSAARNQGIRLSVGEYVLFLDSDDYLKENIIENLMHTISSTNADVILGKKDLLIEKTHEYVESTVNYEKYKTMSTPFEVYKELIKYDPFYFTSSIFLVKREFMNTKNLLFKEGIYHEDELWTMRVFLSSKSIEIVDASIYCYRVGREGSIIQTRNIKKEFDKLLIIDEYEIMGDFLDNKREKNVLKERKAFLQWLVIQEFNYYQNDPEVEELKKWLNERMKCLAYGRYAWRYLLCKVFGVKKICNMNVKWSYLRNGSHLFNMNK